jgi:hypothetical protein
LFCATVLIIHSCTTTTLGSIIASVTTKGTQNPCQIWIDNRLEGSGKIFKFECLALYSANCLMKHSGLTKL